MRSLLVFVMAAFAAGLACAAPGRAATSGVLVGAAGDIACDPANPNYRGGTGTANNCTQLATSNLLVGAQPAAVLPLGDDQYECGGLSAFQQSYAPSWGRLLSVTHPAIGNHEYYTSGGTGCDTTGAAAGYFSYFGARAGDPSRGYYSYDLGGWHLIALNSNCAKVGGCFLGSPEEKWLRADLAAHPTACTLAYWHHPRWSSTVGSVASKNFWNDLYAAGAEIVLSGHIHNYERFTTMAAAGDVDMAKGMREFVVGTGGQSLQSFSTPLATSEVRKKNFGVLLLTLQSKSYDWRFVGTTGQVLDSGGTTCHAPPTH
jgi:hypothetical protein